MKRWRPKLVKIGSLSGDRVLQFGVETWRTEYERQLPWGSTGDGAERFLLLHLGTVAIEWRWPA